MASTLAWKVSAEPTSGPLLINTVRAYVNETIFISVSSSSFCGTDTFLIPSSGANKMLAMVLAAQQTNRHVLLEASNTTGCNGWGTTLQSIYSLSN